jgi:3-oxoacyl-[acyl-carrier-protein] synthase-1
MHKAPVPPVLVEAIGAATALGDHVTAAAAARAQISRPGPVLDLMVPDSEDGEPIPLTAFPVASLTTGFEGLGRLVRLSVDALEDLAASQSEGINWERAALFIATTGPLMDDEPPESRSNDDEVTFEDPPASVEEWADSLATAIVVEAAVAGAGRRTVYTDGRTGTLRALRGAMDAIQAGTIDQAVILAVDSAIDEERLLRWMDQHRLKTSEEPVGFIAGEAAVAVVLSSPRGVRGPRTLLSAPTVAHEPASPEHRPTGQALYQVLEAAAAQAPSGVGCLFSDLNGEDHTALDYGAALARTPADSPLRTCRHVMPAVSFGETGATSPLLGLLLARQAQRRGYAGSGDAIVSVAADDGVRATFNLRYLS